MGSLVQYPTDEDSPEGATGGAGLITMEESNFSQDFEGFEFGLGAGTDTYGTTSASSDLETGAEGTARDTDMGDSPQDMNLDPAADIGAAWNEATPDNPLNAAANLGPDWLDEGAIAVGVLLLLIALRPYMEGANTAADAVSG